MVVARPSEYFMAYQTGCHSIGIEYDERLYEKALINGESPAARNRVSFVLGDAALYELPDQADRCFFFNPFALHTIKRVLGISLIRYIIILGRLSYFFTMLMTRWRTF